MIKDDCEQYQAMLIELMDQQLPPEQTGKTHQHLAQCADCSQALADLWAMDAAVSGWQEQSVPASWNRRSSLAGAEKHNASPQGHGWALWSGISSFASLLVVALVLLQVEVSTVDGLRVQFGRAAPVNVDIEQRLVELETQQINRLQLGLQQVSDQQAAANQFMLQTLLTASRRERREDLRDVVSLFDEAQARQAKQVNTSLRYLIASQAQDQEYFEQLGSVLVNNQMDGNDL